MKRLIVAIAVMSFLAGCSRTPEVVPRLIFQGDEVGDGFWLAAPYVVVVKIVTAELQGPRQPVYRGGPKDLQLVKFVANVENVLKGELSDRTIGFFFFVRVFQKPNYYLDPGKRYIVSLRREGAVLRSWADATQLRIEVHSGSHVQKNLPLFNETRGPSSSSAEPVRYNRGLEATIAHILYTPGADCDLEQFADALDVTSSRYGAPQYLNELLERLQNHPYRRIRDAACLKAVKSGYHPVCLQRCLDSPSSGVRQAAERVLKEADPALPQLLRNDPSALFTQPWGDYTTQQFGIYTRDLRPDVRKAACAALRGFAPQRAGEFCDVPK